MTNTGWICPKCGRVYSPLMVMCSYCGPQEVRSSSGTADCDHEFRDTTSGRTCQKCGHSLWTVSFT